MHKWYVVSYPSLREEHMDKATKNICSTLEVCEEAVRFYVPFLQFDEMERGRIKHHNLRMFPGYGFLIFDTEIGKNAIQTFLQVFDNYSSIIKVLTYSTKSGNSYYALSLAEVQLINRQVKFGIERPTNKLHIGAPIRINQGLFKGVDGVIVDIRRGAVFASILCLGAESLIKLRQKEVTLLGISSFEGFKDALSYRLGREYIPLLAETATAQSMS